MPRLFIFPASVTENLSAVSYAGQIVNKLFVGHIRFAADGAPEFATGWNDVDAPKERLLDASLPSFRASRWWFDAFATSDQAAPFTIEPCRCGTKTSLPGLGRPVKPFSKKNTR
jgi:hypothetical protein